MELALHIHNRIQLKIRLDTNSFILISIETNAKGRSFHHLIQANVYAHKNHFAQLLIKIKFNLGDGGGGCAGGDGGGGDGGGGG